MTTEMVLGQRIDLCPTCKGVFIAGDDIERNRSGDCGFDLSETYGKREYKNGTRPCPGCQNTLSGHEFVYDSAIHIDRCDLCSGVFISSDELPRIEQYIEHENTTRGLPDGFASRITMLRHGSWNR